MKTDWNGNGKHDRTDDYMDYILSSRSKDSTSNVHPHSSVNNAGITRIPTWLLIVVPLSIVSGELPINGLTVIIAVIIAIVIWIRIIR